MRRRAITAFAIAIAGCGGSAASERGEVVLRVSATHGLAPFSLSANVSGSTAYALDLVYLPVSEPVMLVSRADVEVVLRRASHSSYGAPELAAALRADGLIRAVADGELIRATFSSAALAERFSGLEFGGFDLGPFELATQDLDRGILEFRSRSDTAVDRIVIVGMNAGDEWRRLMARNIDVIPSTPLRNREQFAGMNSIRVVSFDSEGAYGLVFNTQAPLFATAASRRAVADALDLDSLAAVVCGEVGCALGGSDVARQTSGHGAAPALPERIELIAPDLEPARTAARDIRFQLGRAGVAVELRLVPVAIFAQAAIEGAQLMLLPIPSDEVALQRNLASGGFFAKISGYASTETESSNAVSSGDVQRARASLQHDRPVLPLFRELRFAAIDNRFCGGSPKRTTSWRWLADLYPCDRGSEDRR